MNLRTCPQCGESKELTADNFYKRASRPDGFTYSCKDCINKKAAWKTRDPETYRKNLRKFYYSEKGRKWALRARLRRYDLTEESYDKLLESQDRKCAVCGKPMGAVAIDHSHHTGKTRGLLHPNCNALLGLAGENIDVLQGAIAYLERNS